MTFTNVHSQTATSSGLAILYGAGATVAGNGNKLQWANQDTARGASVCSVASGVITLPAGYYYLLEGCAGCLSTIGVYDVWLQFYDENSSSYVGSEAFMSAHLGGGGEHYRPFSMDDCARLWVDATGSAGSISFRQQNQTGGPVTNYDSNALGRRRTGYSRCLVWRFD